MPKPLFFTQVSVDSALSSPLITNIRFFQEMFTLGVF